jgi:DNA-binding NarL/FixJ family response regulator
LTAIDTSQTGSITGKCHKAGSDGLLARAIREETTAGQRDSATLTKHEQEILHGLVHGLSNKLIARNLDITEVTVKVRVRNLLKKLGFRSRLEAAVWTAGGCGAVSDSLM